MEVMVDLEYFGAIDWFKSIAGYKHVEIEQWDWYKKGSYRNRTVISGSNGPISLTVPILGGREQKAIIKDIRIDHSFSWEKIHCRAIQSSYAKAPFYPYYFDDVFNLINNPAKYLVDLNLAILEWLHKVLKLEFKFSLTSSFQPTVQNDQRYKLDPRTKHDPDTWKPRYFQVFQDRHGFIPNLGILDLLFSEGPNTKKLLTGSNSY